MRRLPGPAPHSAGGVAHRSMRIYAVPHINCEAVSMKNITVSVDEETHRLARIRAAEMDTSVSALVRDYLRSLVDGQNQERTADARRVETARERRRRLLNEVLADFDARGVGLRMADNLPRQALYDRAAARTEAEAERDRRRHAST